MGNSPASSPWPGAMTRVSSMTSRENASFARTAANASARPPSRTVPVVCCLAPVRSMLSGTLNMSTMVVLQYMPEALYVNSTQSCRTG